MTDAVFPTVSICSLTFYIPWNFPTDFESFKERMDFAILGSQGFLDKCSIAASMNCLLHVISFPLSCIIIIISLTVA